MTTFRFRAAWLAPLALAVAAHAAAAQAPAADEDSAAQQQLTERYIKAAFDNMDTNKDGKIDQAEFHAFMLKYLARQKAAFDNDFAAADANHDGKLSRAEAQRANPLVAAHFSEIDTNSDGFVDKDELRAAIRERQLRVVLHGDDADDGQAPASTGSAH